MNTLFSDTTSAGGQRLRALGLFLIGSLGLLLYGHTLPFPFVFDDYIYLVDNPLLKDIRSFIWNGDFTAFANCSEKLGLDPDISTNMILRPVTYFTFYLNYLFDGMQPRGFRAVNILIHGANACLLLLVVSRLLRSSQKRGALTDLSVEFIAATAALLFFVHPLQIESVTYIVQRFTSLGTLFYLLVILTFLRAHAADDWRVARRWRALSIACLIIGLFSKEFLFTAPVLLFLLDWLVLGTAPAAAGRRALPHFLCMPIIPLFLIFIAMAQNEGSASLTATLNITNAGNSTPYQYALTQLSVVLTYLRLIFVPTGLNLDWDYPLTTAWWKNAAFFPALLIAALLGATVWWYRRHGRHDVRHALLCLGVLWFFLTVSIDSSIVPLPDLMCEHRAYLPSIGILCALAAGADLLRARLARWPRLRLLMPALVTAWLLALAIGTNVRQQVWHSEISIWLDATEKSPQKFRPWFNLGTAYFEHNEPRRAVACIRKAIPLQPQCFASYRNLGRVENTLGHYREAREALQIGLALAPNDVEQHLEMGIAYDGLGDAQQCEREFLKTIQLQPNHRVAHLALGTLYAKQRQFERALNHLHAADNLQPLDAKQRQFAAQVAIAASQQQRQAP